jgi:integrase
MGITVKKHKGSWWVFVNYHGRRKAKKVGTEKAAYAVKAKLEIALALGDFSCLDKDETAIFTDYARTCLERMTLRCKASTIDTYKDNHQRYVIPRFGEWKLTSITRADIDIWLAELNRKNLTLNTIRLALASLRVVLSCAVHDGHIAVNPAFKLLRSLDIEKPAQRAQSMEPEEVEEFLETALDYCPDFYPLFLVALRAGLREGELLGLRWGDCQFGKDDTDSNRFFWIQRRWYRGRRSGQGTWSSPKNRKDRRVDMSPKVRRVLIELRDKRLLEAFQMGRETIMDDLVFPGVDGNPITIRTLEGHFQAVLEKAGLRHFRFQDLRHTYGSLLFHRGASLPYVSTQMGHSSITVTAKIYIHLIQSGNIQWVDKLDDSMQPSATQTQPEIKNEK